VNHPGAAEWMAFLYEELPPATRRELGAHLAQCSSCAAQLQTWRASMNALDQWPPPAARRPARQWVPALKWAAAAAVILLLGFGIGRQTSSNAREIAALKASVAKLEQAVGSEPDSDVNAAIEAATTTANTETLRLLAEYSRAQEEQRAVDRQADSLAFRAFDAQLANLRAELETVALNTESGFQQTHDNLVQLASFSAPAQTPEPK
jgi:hypothetical protein